MQSVEHALVGKKSDGPQPVMLLVYTESHADVSPVAWVVSSDDSEYASCCAKTIVIRLERPKRKRVNNFIVSDSNLWKSNDR